MELQKNYTWLLIGAIYFAMRSCEYVRTTNHECNKRTKILRLKNIVFKKNGQILDHDSVHLLYADMVIITFEFQKNNIRNRTVHMFRTGDPLLCPVVAWATTIKRILRTVPNASENTKVSSFYMNGQIKEVDASTLRSRLRSIVDVIGKNVLGFTKDDVGLHSIRSVGAMAMFLSGVSDIIIQRVGRWESNAFMEYIREQVETFTYGVSKKMLKNEQFYHLNNIESDQKYTSDTNHT